MINDLTLSEARSLVKDLGGTYCKTGVWRYDNDRNEFVHEDSWTYMSWTEYRVWKMQK